MNQLEQIEKARKALASCEHWSDEMSAGWEILEKIKENQKEGIYLGKIFTYSVADGYAMYYISKINAKTVRLTHVPEYVDGYKQYGLYDGATVGLARITAESNAVDRFNKLFKK